MKCGLFLTVLLIFVEESVGNNNVRCDKTKRLYNLESYRQLYSDPQNLLALGEDFKKTAIKVTCDSCVVYFCTHFNETLTFGYGCPQDYLTDCDPKFLTINEVAKKFVKATDIYFSGSKDYVLIGCKTGDRCIIDHHVDTGDVWKKYGFGGKFFEILEEFKKRMSGRSKILVRYEDDSREAH